MKTKFKLIALVTLICATLSLAVSCSEPPANTTYEKDGLSFYLPTLMREIKSDYYDICYATVVYSFGAIKLTPDFLASEGLAEDTGAKEYTDYYFEINGISRDECEIVYREKQNAYAFSYSVSSDGVNYDYNYCVILEGEGCLWYTVFTCAYDDAATYLGSFEMYSKHIEVIGE